MLLPNKHRVILTSLICLVLAACAATPPVASEVGATEVRNPDPQIRVLSEAEVVTGRAGVDLRRLIPDLLFEALQALDDDRLLTPIDDNAHSRFMRVLAYQPSNEIALQGIQDIVARYLQLAEEAMRRGLFIDAETMVDRARFVDADHPRIAGVVEAIAQEMNSKDLFFNLEGSEFSQRNESAQQQLADIAKQAKENNAFFLITAPTDDLARWMYSVMRESVSGYRLRGNIELAGRTSVRLRMPKESE